MDIHCRYVMNTRRGINTYTCICVDDIYLRDVIFHFFTLGHNILENFQRLDQFFSVSNTFFLFSAFCVFPSAIHTLLLETLRRNIFLWKSITEKRIRRLGLTVLR